MAAESIQSPPTLDEARHAMRLSCEVPTTCQPPSSWSKDPWPATIRDISNSCLSLTLHRRFECGSGLAIELPGEEGTTSTILARITQVQSFASGLWLLDCKLISELGDEEVRHVLQLDASRPESGAPAVNGVLFQARLETGEKLRWIVKRLELAGTWPLPRDKVIAMRVGGLTRPAAPIELRVRRCQLFGSYWVIDCRFVAAPADEVLAALTAPPPIPS